jgi:hypothetical protein
LPLKSWQSLIDEAGSSGDVLPAADYDVRIVKSVPKMSGNGKLMYVITCEVTTGPYEGRQVSSNIVVTHDNPIALAVFFRQMNAIGMGKEFFAANPDDFQVADAMLGREFRIQVPTPSLARHIREVVDTAPPLTPEKRARLRVLLGVSDVEETR